MKAYVQNLCGAIAANVIPAVMLTAAGMPCTLCAAVLAVYSVTAAAALTVYDRMKGE